MELVSINFEGEQKNSYTVGDPLAMKVEVNYNGPKVRGKVKYHSAPRRLPSSKKANSDCTLKGGRFWARQALSFSCLLLYIATFVQPRCMAPITHVTLTLRPLIFSSVQH